MVTVNNPRAKRPYRFGEKDAMAPEAAVQSDKNNDVPRLENLTLSQRAHTFLRDEILSNRLPPGTELQEVALSQQLGVSRGPIREALGRLAAEGLVTVRPRRGAVVHSLSSGEFLEAYQVRAAIFAAPSPNIARSCARRVRATPRKRRC